MSIYIALRDLSVKPHKIVVEVEKACDWESGEEDDSENGALGEFVRQVSALHSIPEHADVFISWFEDQGDIKFSLDFLDLVSRKNWEVALSLND